MVASITSNFGVFSTGVCFSSSDFIFVVETWNLIPFVVNDVLWILFHLSLAIFYRKIHDTWIVLNAKCLKSFQLYWNNGWLHWMELIRFWTHLGLLESFLKFLLLWSPSELFYSIAYWSVSQLLYLMNLVKRLLQLFNYL